MATTTSNSHVGDGKSPALQPVGVTLKTVSDKAGKIPANQSGQARKSSTVEDCMVALQSASLRKGSPTSCKQSLWLSFFFDGTGNNQELDLRLLKHSNIARLYRAHKPTSPLEGILSVYVPGVGTHFPEIGDPGGSSAGLGCGAMGEERLNFALKEFDQFLKMPLAKANSPANAIRNINIVVFGFSRGAALARAFVNLIMDERCRLQGRRWVLQNGEWPVHFRFLGLFDTVASVGTPMSCALSMSALLWVQVPP